MKTITNTMKKVLIIAAFTFIMFNVNAFSYVEANGSETGYTPPKTIGLSNVSIKIMIEDGAGYFIKAKADIQSFLNILEWQDTRGIDYSELNQALKTSLYSIILSRSNYEELIRVAESTPYNTVVIERLKTFDYDSFGKAYYLNPFIFNIVKGYLLKGDITGTYKYTNGKLKEIEALIQKIQLENASNGLPDISLCWRVNELCAETTLFGSYIARVFKAIQ